VSLQEAQRLIRSRNNRRPTVAITFDDGYSENLKNAFPLLAKRRIPATYFVSTDFVKSGRTFPHDLENGRHLAPNTIDELRRIADQGFELGAHTRTHCDLGAITHRDRLWDEIVGSAQELEQWCHVDVKYFSFPTGMPCNTSQLAVDVIREAGFFEGFCTAYGAWNWPGSDGFHLRRIHADPGLQSLKNWLTYDPRKLIEHQQIPFDESNLSCPKLQTHSC
jgi:peptidoglycan/xylan/chitin deacetylase (PgdA/CDA1 family)